MSSPDLLVPALLLRHVLAGRSPARRASSSTCSGEGGKAHDIFHVMKDGAKVADADRPLVAQALEEAAG